MIARALPSPRFAFRTDASIQIGTGHVMRCLTLADALREREADCLFLCRPHDGNLSAFIASRGHRVHVLSAPREAGAFITGDDPAHASWLGTDWASDGEESLAALMGAQIDWLVLDHYALDARWEEKLRPACRQLMVIDDLADRRHDCDLLLDPGLGRMAADYEHLLPARTKLLLGPHHALLRPEFTRLRKESLARRAHPRLQHLLITMGGIDKDDATSQILDGLESCPLPEDLRITVVMGPQAPWLARVRDRAARMTRPTRVLVGVNDMARLMSDSDLAIGAAGSTAWERCCLGLPSLILVLAENQQVLAAALQSIGAALAAADICELIELLRRQLSAGDMDQQLVELGAAAAQLCDGRGVWRLLPAIDI